MTKTTMTVKLLAAISLATGGVAFADAPRTLGNGRPACGNTMKGKGGSRSSAACETEARTVEATRNVEVRAVAAIARELTTLFAASPIALVSVRVLDNGRPACGNTTTKAMPKSAPDDDCETI